MLVPRVEGAAVAALVTVAALGGPAAYALSTAATPHTGAIPSAGPNVAGGRGPGGAGGQFAPPRNAAGPGNNAGGVGGLLNGSTSNPALTAALRADASKYTWVAATVGANQAAGYQLASGDPVMSIGGFNGTDPWPTLSLFEKYVSEGKIHYFIAGGGSGTRGGPRGAGGPQVSSDSSAITAWVESHSSAVTIGGVTVYDLTQPATAG